MSKQIKHLSSLGLALVLAFGVMGVWYTGAAIIVPSFGEFLLREKEGTYDYYNEYLEVLQDGTPIIMICSSRHSVTFRTLDGKPFPDAESMWMQEGCGMSSPQWKEAPFPGLTWRQRICNMINVMSPSPSGEWYFVHNGQKNGRAYFVGFDDHTYMPIGYIGLNGYRSDEPPEGEQFRVDGRLLADDSFFPLMGGMENDEETKQHANCYVLSGGGLFEINFTARTSRLLLNDANLCSLNIIKNQFHRKRQNPEAPAPQFLGVRTPDHVFLLNAAGKRVRSYLVPPEIREKGFAWYDLGHEKVLIIVSPPVGRGVDTQCGSHWLGTGGKAILYWLEKDGKVVRHEELVLRGEQGVPGRGFAVDRFRFMAEEVLPREGKRRLGGLMALVIPSPVFISLATVTNAQIDKADNLFMVLLQTARESKSGLLILGVVCIVLAWRCYRRQRAFGLPWTGAWVAFVLLMGAPGYFAYLAHRTWPARLPCPTCGRLVPRDRPACFACGHDFPPPARKGIEVFA